MSREDIVAKLRATEPALRTHGIAALYLFGSYARDEARENSDLDVFIDPVEPQSFGLVPLMESHALLARAFPGIDVSLSTREGIVPCYRPYIERSAIQVF